MPDFIFDLQLQGTGVDADEAWCNAVDAFIADPGGAPDAGGFPAKISYPLLREQKAYLQSLYPNEHASGLVHLLDHLMDEAVARGVPVTAVFGEAQNG